MQVCTASAGEDDREKVGVSSDGFAFVVRLR